jgi:hypothetical protein
MHKYSVSLTIVGDDLDEAEVSRMLGLKPSVFHRKGDPRSAKSQKYKYETSAWLFHFDPTDGKHDWESLEAGLRGLIETLGTLEPSLQELGRRFRLAAYCGHFGSGFGGGPTISPETLGMLAQLGLNLTIDTYWRSTEPDS